MTKFIDQQGLAHIWGKIKEKVEPIEEKVYKAHGAVSVTVSPSVIEKGQSVSVTVTSKVTLSGDTFSPAVFSLKQGSTPVEGATANAGKSVSLSDTATFTAEAQFLPTVSKRGSATVTAVYPMYFGSSAKGSGLASADVTGMVKQTLKTSPNGTYNVAVTQGHYLWLCVPSGMKVNKVASSGFDVPMEAAVTVAVTGKGNYSCYRSSSQFNAGTVNIVVS